MARAEAVHIGDDEPMTLAEACETLFGDRIKSATLRAEWRRGRLMLERIGRQQAGARRDLEDLRAAINHHGKEGLHRGIVRVVLPAKGRPKERWLTRSEAARLLWTCWRQREIQTAHRGPLKGQRIETDKRPLRHLARFILIGLYTGTRAGAVATASLSREEGRSWVDLDRGVFYRLAIGRRATDKRQPPVRLTPRLLAHMRRWARLDPGMGHFVEWNGRAIASIKTGFATAVRLAGLPGPVSPHTLRHTAAADRWLKREKPAAPLRRRRAGQSHGAEEGRPPAPVPSSCEEALSRGNRRQIMRSAIIPEPFDLRGRDGRRDQRLI